MPLGLYIHIPFCAKKCHYCNFVITTQSAKAERTRFLKALQKEIKAAHEKYGSLKFQTIYFGGGTPSLLNPDEMKWLIQLLKESFEFDLSVEFTCEANPEDIQKDKAQAFKELGINRISLGAQAFQNSLLKSMNRVHGVDQIFKSYEILREVGYSNINLDLICRLPKQNLEEFKYSVKQIEALDPEQVTLYDLEVHPQTVFGKGQLSLPGENEHLEMVRFAEDAFARIGLENYALACYAKPGFEAKHNLIYWNNQEYLGLGPGAFSYMKGIRYQFAESVSTYLEKCEKGTWQADVEDVLTDREKELETLMTGLRLRKGVCLDRLRSLQGTFEEKCHNLLKGKILAIEENRVFLTQKGRFLVENVFEELIEAFREKT